MILRAMGVLLIIAGAGMLIYWSQGGTSTGRWSGDRATPVLLYGVICLWLGVIFSRAR